MPETMTEVLDVSDEEGKLQLQREPAAHSPMNRATSGPAAMSSFITHLSWKTPSVNPFNLYSLHTLASVLASVATVRWTFLFVPLCGFK